MAENFGKQLAKIRIIHNLTQEQLAEKMNTSRQTVSHWENGRVQPDAQTVARLEALLHTSFDDFSKQDMLKASAQNTSAHKPGKKVSLAIAFACGFLAACLLFFVIFPVQRPLPAEESHPAPSQVESSFPFEWYQQPVSQKEGTPYLEFTPFASTNKLRHAANQSYEYYWQCSYRVTEKNGFPFTVTHISYTLFTTETQVGYVMEYEGEGVREVCGTPEIPAGGQFANNINIAANNYIGMGIAVCGVDENENELAFGTYLPFSQEIEEVTAKAADYQTSAPKQDGKGYLRLTAIENPVHPVESPEFPNAGRGWFYGYTLANESDISIALTKLEEIAFDANGDELVRDAYEADDIASFWRISALLPGETTDRIGGMPLQDVGFVAYQITYEDANGHEAEARLLFTLLQE